MNNTEVQLYSTHANMACSNNQLEIDNDSTFGDDDSFWISNPMFSTPTVAGTKRGAQDLGDDAQIRRAGSDRLEYLAGADDTDQDTPCCCPDACSEAGGIRPSKRRASVLQVSEFHSADADCQFPDDCFEKFCQECNLDASCLPDCAVPCPADAECTTPDACWDPHCSPKQLECADGCVDPECTKLSCPEKTCFCQDCGVQPCPLGDPDSECHFAHTAPTTTGAIYCYDNAPCHFQERLHGHDTGLSSYETYPCFSQTHGFTNGDDITTQASSVPTPALSHSNYTSLESAFTFEPSPVPRQKSFSDCFLDVLGDHCHIDNSCCHGPDRACGDFPSASKQQLDMWNLSTAQGNGLSNNFMNFGLGSSPTSPMSASSNAFSNSLYSPILGFNDSSWMSMDPTLTASFSPDMLEFNKLDYLASAVQQDILKPTSALRETTALDGSIQSGSSGSEHCICRWYVCPNERSTFCILPRQQPAPSTITSTNLSLQGTHPRQPLPRILPHALCPTRPHQVLSRRFLYLLLLPLVRLRRLNKRLQATLEALSTPARPCRSPSLPMHVSRLPQNLCHQPSQRQPRTHPYWRAALYM